MGRKSRASVFGELNADPIQLFSGCVWSLDGHRRQHNTDAFHLAWSAEDKGVERFHAIYLLRIAVVVGAGVVCWLVGLRL